MLSDSVKTNSSERKKRNLLKPVSKDDEQNYKPFIKSGYRNNYGDSAETDIKLGNKNPLVVSKYFKQVKRICESRRINANKIMLVFKQQQATMANDPSHECLKVQLFQVINSKENLKEENKTVEKPGSPLEYPLDFGQVLDDAKNVFGKVVGKMLAKKRLLGFDANNWYW